MTVHPHLTDEALLADLATFEKDPYAKGLKARYDYLMPIPAEDRNSVSSLASVIMNRTPGYRYSDALYAAVLVYTTGGAEACDARVERDR